MSLAGSDFKEHFQGWCSAGLDLSDSAPHQDGVGANMKVFSRGAVALC